MCSPSPSSAVVPARLLNGRKLRVALLDDHPVVLEGLRFMLSARQDMQLVAACQTPAELSAVLKAEACDVLVCDFHLPQAETDGARLLSRLRRDYPDLLLVVCSGDRSAAAVNASCQAGANGFWGKQQSLDGMPAFFHALQQNRRQFLLAQDGHWQCLPAPLAGGELSPAEQEVLRLLAHGLSVVQVAERLHRSKQTVSTHKHNAMRKLQLGDELSLALYLREQYSRSWSRTSTNPPR
ncbi:response regulator transcription factor [Paludibacterium sp. THUN1379]|uniref:response regulator transcription factor n=1 Tax=Paludibacterium sp. THUN1379 TaxID=3112107 RepID=UPI0030915D9A|nr:response regulator transcription factor [Paludibacterium sp. THUN1379]